MESEGFRHDRVGVSGGCCIITVEGSGPPPRKGERMAWCNKNEASGLGR